MAEEIKYEILDKSRREIMARLKWLKKSFYLAGGTALALQLGHRDSVDFDYFTEDDFDSIRLFQDFESTFPEYSIEQIQNAENTLSLLVNKKIKFSFFKLPYGTVLPLIDTDCFYLLPAKEIAVMKIIALLRATYRDYVDLYYLLQQYNLADLFALAKKKHKNFDAGIYLKCLLSYCDVEITPIKFKKGFEVTPKKVFSFIEKATNYYLKKG